MRLPICIGFVVALVALCFPQDRLVGEAFAGGFEHSPLWAIWHRFGWRAGQMVGRHGEQVRFFVAALAYGACLPLAYGLARRLGCPSVLALVASSIMVLAPTAWLAGTTPGMASISLMLSLVLMRALLEPPDRARWVCLGLWGLMVGTQVSALLLWPAVTLACLPSREQARVRINSGRACGLAGIGVLALVVGMNMAEWDPVPLPTDLDFSATRWSIDSRAWVRLGAMLPGLGLAVAGLAGLCLVRRAPSELPARRWLMVWCAVPAPFLLLNSTLTWDASYHWLLPVALLGVSNVLARPDRAQAIALGGGALFAQVALLFALQHHVTSTDPLTHWRETTRDFIEPIDTVITGDARHAYLASHRWGLRSVILRATNPDDPSTQFVDGVYTDPAGQTNLRVKTQNVAAWADEGVEARGFGFRPVLDRPFPAPSKGISDALERELRERVEFSPIDSE